MHDPELFLTSTTFHGGTMRWQAPEIMAREDPSPIDSESALASDIYSFGWVCYEVDFHKYCGLKTKLIPRQIFTGQVPLAHLIDFQVMRAITEGRRSPRPPRTQGNDDIDDTMWQLIEECWAGQPSDRPSSGDIVIRISGAQDSSMAVADWDEEIMGRLKSPLTHIPISVDDSSHGASFSTPGY